MKSIHYGVLGFTTMLATLSPQMAEALEKIGVVGLAGTTVSAQGEDGATRTLKTGDDVYLNDHVTTDAGGKAQLIFLDRSTLTLNENTDLTLDTYVYDPSTAGGTMAISSVKGAFRFVGGALSKKQPVTIKTPVATIGIRGGIADTNIAPNGGASDAVFVYGEELTMTNQNGQSSSTTQIGTGLMLDTPTGSPIPMPPALVNQRMRAFGTPSPEGSGNASNNKGNNGSTQQANNGSRSGSSGTPNGNSSGSSAGGSSSGGGGVTVQLVGDDGGNVGAPITFFGDGTNIVGNTSQDTNNETIRDAAATGDNTLLPGINDVIGTDTGTGSGDGTLAGDTTSGGGDGTLPGDLPPPDPIIAAGDTAVGGSSGGSGSSGGTTVAVTPMRVGEYFHFDAGAGNYAFGTVEMETTANSDAMFTTSFTEASRQNVAAIMSDLYAVSTPIAVDFQSSPGANYSSPGYADIFTDTNLDGTFETGLLTGGKYYASPGDAFRQYYFANSGDPLAFFEGQPIFDVSTTTDASRFAEARIRSVDASIAEGFSGVSFYSFLPDIAKYPSGITDDFGLLDYRLPGSGIGTQNAVLDNFGFTSTTAGELLRTGPGLMVDWQKGRFLTQDVNFEHPYSPYASAAFGVVNSGGPHFLDGAIKYFEGEDSSAAATGFSAGAFNGMAQVDRGIYGSDGGRIEAIMIDANAIGDVYDIPASYIQTNNGQSTIGITVSGADYQPGDHVIIEGLSGADVNGIPVSALNGHEFEVISYTSGILTIDTGYTATATGSGGTAFNVLEHEFSKQAAVLDDSHGLAAATFASQKTGQEMRGFAGGVVKEDSGSIAFAPYASSATTTGPAGAEKISDVVIQSDAANGSITSGTHIYTTDLTNGANTMSGNFGGTNSAYMNDRYYGAEQTSGGGLNVKSGFITTVNHDDSLVHTCATCEYTHWGVWAAEVHDGGSADYTVEMMPYVAGRVTNATEFDAYRASVGNTGTAIYSGAAYGNFQSTGELVENASGSLTANVDLSARAVSSMNMNFGTVLGSNLTIGTSTAMPIATTGDAVFSGTAVDVNWPSTGTTTGVINGALFGPNAEEIGGNFAIQHNEGSTLQGGGVFLGRRP